MKQYTMHGRVKLEFDGRGVTAEAIEIVILDLMFNGGWPAITWWLHNGGRQIFLELSAR